MPLDSRPSREAILEAWARDPLAFVTSAFAWGQGDLSDEAGPDEWQSGILAHIRDNALTFDAAMRIAVASGHGVGKTALVAWLCLWFMATRPHPQIVVTANTATQLETKTWRELAVWHNRMVAPFGECFKWTATRFFHVAHPETWFASAIPWTKERSEAFAGTHADHVLVVFDEASAIDTAIWEVVEGALTTRGVMWLAFGNPTRNTGRFAECFGRFRHRWHGVHVDSRTAKKANRAQIDQWIADYGEDSDFVRVRVRGVFPSASSEQFIAGGDVEAARRRVATSFKGAGKSAGVDVARFGDDQTVLLLRQGNAIVDIRRFRGLDLMQTAARVTEFFDAHQPDALFIDGVGVGGGVVDRLRQLGYRCNDVNAGAKAVEDQKYMNLRAEMWGKMRDWIKAGGCLPERDEELASDLTGPEYHFDARNRLCIERKDDMKSRGLASPDAADALALTFASNVRPKGAGRDLKYPGLGYA